MGKEDVAIGLWEEGLICFDPERGEWVLTEEYCSGDIVDKLEALERDWGYADWIKRTLKRNRELLEAVRPAACLPEASLEIKVGVCEALGMREPILDNTFRLEPNTHWIGEETIRRFIVELFEVPADLVEVKYLRTINLWQLRCPNYYKVRVIYGTPHLNGIELLERKMNLLEIRVLDKDNKLDVQGTALANSKAQAIIAKWHEWVFADLDRAIALTREYNLRYRSRVARQYNGNHLELSNCTQKLRDYQQDAVWQILQRPTTLLPHKVGWGKTWIMVSAIMELKRMGLARKPLLVGLKSTIPQLKQEFLKLYPHAKLIVADEDNFTKSGRTDLFATIATASDVDCIIISHSQFFFLKCSIATEKAFIEEEIDNISQALKESRNPIKGMQQRLKNLKQKLYEVTKRKDNVIDWNSLGIDALFIDEFHYFKNLKYTTRMQSIAGLPNTGSQRALDTLLKIREILQKNGKVVVATGTPIANTIAEIYTLQRYLDYETLERLGLNFFDQWITQFGKLVSGPEVTLTGDYVLYNRFSSFRNIPELLQLLQEFRAVPRNVPYIPVPQAKYITISSPSSPEQSAYIVSLAQRAEAIRKGVVDRCEDNMLTINTDGRKCFIDPRLVMPQASNYVYSKLNRAAVTIMGIYQATRADHAIQLVFCDFSTPHPTKHNAYRYLKDVVVGLGMPPDQFAIIHEEDDLEELYAQARSGKISVLMGSTSKLGTGVNVQDRVIAHHDIDAALRPCDMEQRLGRSIRYGNQYPEVCVVRYVTEGTAGRASFEATLWQRLEMKQRFYNQINNNQVNCREIEDFDEVVLSYAEIKACAIGNPLITERAQCEMEIAKLKIEQKALEENNYRIAREIKQLESRQQQIPSLINQVNQDLLDLPTDLQLIAGDKVIENPKLHLRFCVIQAKQQSSEVVVGRIGKFTVHSLPIGMLSLTTANSRYTITDATWQGLTDYIANLHDRPANLQAELANIPHKIAELHKAYDNRDLRAKINDHHQRIEEIDEILYVELKNSTHNQEIDIINTDRQKTIPPYIPPEPELIDLLKAELANFQPDWLQKLVSVQPEQLQKVENPDSLVQPEQLRKIENSDRPVQLEQLRKTKKAVKPEQLTLFDL